jgi:hypothetical protein
MFRSGLPDGRHHGHFPQMWQFKKMKARGNIVAVSGRKVAVQGPNMAVEKLLLQSEVKLI